MLVDLGMQHVLDAGLIGLIASASYATITALS